jgi:4-amino-4-deoxy-L-arabinose transferase-like glycosyltransferase
MVRVSANAGVASAGARLRRPAIRIEHLALAALCAISAFGLALRLVELDDVAANPFYDAAVRSMGQSWHNFFYGAFEPGGSLAIDKPAVDLWFQVLSVKLLGFSPLALKLPEALGGAAAVPLLYDTVRRLFGRGAGLAAAAALSVLPVSVLTARSDTTDSVMMALLVGAAWLTVRAAERDRVALLCAAGAAIGLAFNVKLFEALIPVPALALLYLLAAEGPLRRRTIHLVAAGATLALVALAWVAVASAGGRHPYPIGSADGTVWNVVFDFNGGGRLADGGSMRGVSAPGPLRLLVRGGSHYGGDLGSELGPAVLLGLLALVFAGRRVGRVQRAAAVAFGVWLVTGAVLFSHMARLHPRYVEAFTPAVAAVLGVGIVALARRGRREPLRVAATAVALAGIVVYEAYLGRTQPEAVRIAAIAGMAAAVARVVVSRARGSAASRGRGSPLARGSAFAAPLLAAVACLALPAGISLALVRSTASDAGRLASLPAPEAIRLSAFLRAHRGSARYDLATYDPARVATLITDGLHRILPLSSWEGRPLVGLPELRARAAAGQVRYVLTDSERCRPTSRRAGCLPAVRWARRHGTDVSSAAGIGAQFRLYRLSRG